MAFDGPILPAFQKFILSIIQILQFPFIGNIGRFIGF